jgi:hypothetical protein
VVILKKLLVEPIERKLMAVMAYRTQDGLADYGFSIEFESDKGWRAYIVFQPLHQGQQESLRLPYQSMDDNGRRYVAWPEKLDSLGDAKTVAALWAELAHRSQRSQEQHALYVELIKHNQRAQEKKGTHVSSDRRGNAVDPGGAALRHQDCDPAMPNFTTSQQSR